jgi:ketosteroid isomerase-like protein
MHELTERFTDALHQLHAERDVDPMVALFTDDAELNKLDDRHDAHGQEGARTFWTDYRDVFDSIEATFTHVVEGEDSVALEWTSTGSLAGGTPFSYRGVSVLQAAGDRLSGFRTYYDTAAFTATAKG